MGLRPGVGPPSTPLFRTRAGPPGRRPPCRLGTPRPLPPKETPFLAIVVVGRPRRHTEADGLLLAAKEAPTRPVPQVVPRPAPPAILVVGVAPRLLETTVTPRRLPVRPEEVFLPVTRPVGLLVHVVPALVAPLVGQVRPPGSPGRRLSVAVRPILHTRLVPDEVPRLVHIGPAVLFRPAPSTFARRRPVPVPVRQAGRAPTSPAGAGPSGHARETLFQHARPRLGLVVGRLPGGLGGRRLVVVVLPTLLGQVVAVVVGRHLLGLPRPRPRPGVGLPVRPARTALTVLVAGRVLLAATGVLPVVALAVPLGRAAPPIALGRRLVVLGLALGPARLVLGLAPGAFRTPTARPRLGVAPARLCFLLPLGLDFTVCD